MSQQSVRQAARPSALDALAERRKQRADRERRLEGLAVAVLTALGERDAAVRGADRRAGEALQTMRTTKACRCGRRSSGTRQPRDDFEADAPVMSTKSESAAAEWTTRFRSSSTATPASIRP